MYRKNLCCIVTAMAIIVSATSCSPSRPASDGPAEPPADVVAAAASSEANVPQGDRNPEVTEPGLDILIVFRGNDNSSSLERVMSYTETVDEQVIVDKLIEYGVLEDGTDILSFEITEEGNSTAESETESNGPMGGGATTRIGHLDLSKLPETPDENSENVLLNCIAGSFMEDFALDGLQLSVNGEPYSDELLTINMKYKNVTEG